MALTPAVEVRERRLAGSQSHRSQKEERKLEGKRQMKERGEKKAKRWRGEKGSEDKKEDKGP